MFCRLFHTRKPITLKKYQFDLNDTGILYDAIHLLELLKQEAARQMREGDYGDCAEYEDAYVKVDIAGSGLSNDQFAAACGLLGHAVSTICDKGVFRNHLRLGFHQSSDTKVFISASLTSNFRKKIHDQEVMPTILAKIPFGEIEKKLSTTALAFFSEWKQSNDSSRLFQYFKDEDQQARVYWTLKCIESTVQDIDPLFKFKLKQQPPKDGPHSYWYTIDRAAYETAALFLLGENAKVQQRFRC